VRSLLRKVERDATRQVRACYEAGPGGYALQGQVTTPRVDCIVCRHSVELALMPRHSSESRSDATKEHSRRSIAQSQPSGVCKALDLDQLGSDHFIDRDNGRSIRLGQLPRALLDLATQKRDEVAILSWRWDVDPVSNSSRNVYVACQEARHQGVRYLLLDKVTVNQDLSDEEMLGERLAFSRLYNEVPVIAAYDFKSLDEVAPTAEVHGAHVALGMPLSRIMRRPWICYEVLLYGSNPTKVTYVGHVPDLGCSKDFGFHHMAETLWESSLCQTILYTLAGTVGMHNVDDFRFILPQYSALLMAAYSRMSRNDYLLTAALLSGRDGSRINEDQSILDISFDLFRIGEGYVPEDLPRTQDYYTRYDIYFGDEIVAKWQTQHKFYPAEELRVWFKVESRAESVMCRFLGTGKPATRRRRLPSAQADRPTPGVSVVFHERDAL